MPLNSFFRRLEDVPRDWQPTWVIENLWQTEGINLLFGAPRARKSTLRGYLMACAVLGRPAFGSMPIGKPIQRALLVLGEELVEAEGSRLHQTFEALGATRADYSERVTLVPPSAGFRLDGARDVQELAALVKSDGYDFVVFDPLVNFHRQNENDASAMSGIMRAVHQFVLSGATVVAVHHESKPSEQTAGRSDAQRARGSSALTGHTVSNTRLQSLGSDRARLSFDPKNGPKLEPMELVWNGHLWMATDLSELDMLVKGEIDRFPGGTSNDICEKVEARKSLILASLKRLEGEGLVKALSGPRGSQCWYSRNWFPDPREPVKPQILQLAE